jgi:predicted methyltransferase
MPANLDGTADRVLFIRALHNLNRFNDMDGAASEAYRVLKPGGMVGVVQHRAPESAPAEWADGSKGYLKQSDVIAKFEAAGFKLKDTSDINANPKDVPGADDIVWRLPPSLNGTEEGTPERAAMEAIGESNRMTLLFMKPA